MNTISIFVKVLQLLELVLHILQCDGLIEQVSLQLAVFSGQTVDCHFHFAFYLVYLVVLQGLYLYPLLVDLRVEFPPRASLVQDAKLVLLILFLEVLIQLLYVLVQSLDVPLKLLHYELQLVLLSFLFLLLTLQSPFVDLIVSLHISQLLTLSVAIMHLPLPLSIPLFTLCLQSVLCIFELFVESKLCFLQLLVQLLEFSILDLIRRS